MIFDLTFNIVKIIERSRHGTGLQPFLSEDAQKPDPVSICPDWGRVPLPVTLIIPVFRSSNIPSANSLPRSKCNKELRTFDPVSGDDLAPIF
ncbi:hypothetical protein SCLCIDRAFT_877729 [Scleroderma citrinum Foug A]|uniref:Uncharacterized protein n=1 Tax=Scleroderma citrinum Foug A TaxID=1036808 RepID=A0A0C2ZIW2_9AGAM|nr:hypothetical protein SCLCIDRAFT_877729 [Scleroderma citrinum Foug A]